MEDLQGKEEILTERLFDASDSLMQALVERDNLQKENDDKWHQLRTLYEVLSCGDYNHPLNVRLFLHQLKQYFENGVPLSFFTGDSIAVPSQIKGDAPRALKGTRF